ncbi:MAG: phage holin family protein, partial [Thermomicrobiales bacterium]
MTPRPTDHRFATWLRTGMNASGVVVRHVVIWVVEALVLIWMAERFPGAYADTFGAALTVVIILATANVLLTPILLRFATRLPAWTFPLITLLLNGVVLYALDGVLPGWNMTYLWWSVLFAL